MRGAVSRAEDSSHVTAAEVSIYLREHKQAPAEMQVLIVDGLTAYCRWPNGSVRWETVASLCARGVAVPACGFLQTRLA